MNRDERDSNEEQQHQYQHVAEEGGYQQLQEQLQEQLQQLHQFSPVYHGDEPSELFPFGNHQHQHHVPMSMSPPSYSCILSMNGTGASRNFGLPSSFYTDIDPINVMMNNVATSTTTDHDEMNNTTINEINNTEMPDQDDDDDNVHANANVHANKPMDFHEDHHADGLNNDHDYYDHDATDEAHVGMMPPCDASIIQSPQVVNISVHVQKQQQQQQNSGRDSNLWKAANVFNATQNPTISAQEMYPMPHNNYSNTIGHGSNGHGRHEHGHGREHDHDHGQSTSAGTSQPITQGQQASGLQNASPGNYGPFSALMATLNDHDRNNNQHNDDKHILQVDAQQQNQLPNQHQQYTHHHRPQQDIPQRHPTAHQHPIQNLPILCKKTSCKPPPTDPTIIELVLPTKTKAQTQTKTKTRTISSPSKTTFLTIPQAIALVHHNNLHSGPQKRKTYSVNMNNNLSSSYNYNAYPSRYRYHPREPNTLPSAKVIAESIPKDASSIFHILDRRIDLDEVDDKVTYYELMRKWVRDDPYRQEPVKGGRILDYLVLPMEQRRRDEEGMEKEIEKLKRFKVEMEMETETETELGNGKCDLLTVGGAGASMMNTSGGADIKLYLKDVIRKGSRKRRMTNRWLKKKDEVCLKRLQKSLGVKVTMKNGA